MLNKNILDEINTKIGEILEHSPAKDVEKNIKVLLSGAFSRLDLVTREEFEVQEAVLQRTREKLTTLEGKLAELEAKIEAKEATTEANKSPYPNPTPLSGPA